LLLSCYSTQSRWNGEDEIVPIEFDRPKGICSLAYSYLDMFGNFPFVVGLNVLDRFYIEYWILHSSAPDHMTPLPKNFSSYTPYTSNKKIFTEMTIPSLRQDKEKLK